MPDKLQAALPAFGQSLNSVPTEHAVGGADWTLTAQQLPEMPDGRQGPIFDLWLFSEEYGVEEGFYNSCSKLWVANVPAYIGVNRTTRHGITKWRHKEARPAAPLSQPARALATL